MPRTRPRPSDDPVRATLAAARRLTVEKQRLTGPVPRRVEGADLRSVVRDLGYVQWDPVPIVAPSHLLSFWARLGPFPPELLDRVLWKERTLLQHWIPFAAIVDTDDYPLFASLMERYPESLTRSWGSHRDRAKKFLAAHLDLRKRILRTLEDGPKTTSEFEDHATSRRDDGDWMPASDLTHMLAHLEMRGEVMVVGHRGAQNLWGRTEAFLPSGTVRKGLPADEFERTAAERAIRALGTATPREILLYFVRGRYADLPGALARLEGDGRIRRVAVEGLGPKDERYVHASDLGRLAELEADPGEPRTTLVPPFDNLVASSQRLERLFDFAYVREQFLPAEKRRFGTYVLPIVRGERLIGRIDPRVDRERKELVVQAVHAEEGAPGGPVVAEEIRASIEGLAAFVGATSVRYPGKIPAAWKHGFAKRSGGSFRKT